MSPESKEYNFCRQEDSSRQQDMLLQLDEDSYYPEPHRGVSLSKRFVTVCIAAFLLSLISNVLLAAHFMRLSQNSSPQKGTEYGTPFPN